MKALLLATAMLATPLSAQTMPPAQPAAPATAPTPPEDATTATDAATTDTTNTATSTDSAAGAPGQPAPGSDAATSANTTAGMQAPMAQTPAPTGAGNVVFQQPASVDQAFPAPPPKANYPWCSRTVTDACKQRVDPK